MTIKGILCSSAGSLAIAGGLMAGVASGAPPKKPAPAPYEVAGVRLGITRAEFAALPIPVGDKYTGLSTRYEPEPMLMSGVAPATRCEWRGRYQGSYSEDQAEVPFGFSSAYPAFVFTSDRAGVERLYEITLVANPDKWELIVPAMSEKYGAPKIVSRPMQNELGATISGRAAVWGNGTGLITVTAPGGNNVNMMCITYDLKALQALRFSSVKPNF